MQRLLSRRVTRAAAPLLALPFLAISVPAFAADAPKAPEPAKPVDAASFYAGRWYEVGRTPKSFNAGCVAGYTDYQTKNGALSERDGCHDKTPDGKELWVSCELSSEIAAGRTAGATYSPASALPV